MSKLIEIRKAGLADVDQICELLFWLKTMYGSCSETALEVFRDHYAPTVRAAVQSHASSIWVAQEPGGTLVGFLGTTRRLVTRLAGEVGTLEEIFIRPEYRRRGFGFQLWQRAIDEFRAHGVRTVEVVTSLAHQGQRPFARKIGLEWYSSIHRIQL